MPRSGEFTHALQLRNSTDGIYLQSPGPESVLLTTEGSDSPWAIISPTALETNSDSQTQSFPDPDSLTQTTVETPMESAAQTADPAELQTPSLAESVSPIGTDLGLFMLSVPMNITGFGHSVEFIQSNVLENVFDLSCTNLNEKSEHITNSIAFPKSDAEFVGDGE
jgi:hypothetical protein